MRALPACGLGLLMLLAGCSTLNRTDFVSRDPAIADVLDGEVEPEPPWIYQNNVIWTDRT